MIENQQGGRFTHLECDLIFTTTKFREVPVSNVNA